jgi:hypothetical protein
MVPDAPVPLPPDTRVRLTIEPLRSDGFLATARSLNLEGPPDWSDRFEEYLGGLRADQTAE